MAPARGIESDGDYPRLVLSMRTKVSLVGLCFVVTVALVAYTEVPNVVEALRGLGQGEPLVENESHTPEQEKPPESMMAEPRLQVWHNLSSGQYIDIHVKVIGVENLSDIGNPHVRYRAVSPNVGQGGSAPAMEPVGEGEWVGRLSRRGYVTIYLVYLQREEEPWLTSGPVLVEHNLKHTEEDISLSITVENPNLTLPAFAVIRANASSPKGIYDVRITYHRFSTLLREEGSLHGVGGGGGGMNLSRVHPSPGYTPRDRNITDGICFFAVFAFDREFNYAVRTGNITIGAPNILIPEPALLPILSLILLPALLRRNRWLKK